MCVSMYLHMQTRPGTENDDFDELMQTYVYTPSSPQTTSPSAKKDMPPEPDPEASLITDFQVVTDIRVNSCMLKRSIIDSLLRLKSGVDNSFNIYC